MANTKVTGDLLTDGTLFARHLNASHGITTSVIGEGTNLFYTDTRVGTYLGTYLPANGYDTATNIIASIVDSAPVTLDTLNELAAALGDDPNFATTVTNSLAGKLPLTGGTLTGALSGTSASFNVVNISQQNGFEIGADAYSGGFYIYDSTNGVYRFKINNNGTTTFSNNTIFSSKVGIGTTSPVDLLHIKSTTNDARIVLDGATGFDAELKFFENGTVKYTIGHDAASGNFVIGTDNVDTNQRLVINSSGNVGIGTTSPIIALSVRKDVNDWIGQFKNYGDSAYGLTVDLSGSTGGQLGYALGVYTQGGTGMFVRNDGRVGIGTTSPAVKLHVDGNALLGASTPNNFGQRYLQIIGSQDTWGNSSATLYLTQLWNGVAYHAIIEAQQGKVYGNAASDLVFKTSYYSGGVNTVERMRITDDGRVGIGTNSPSERLSVEGGSIKLNSNNEAANHYLRLNKKEGQDGGILMSRDNNLDWQMVNVGSSGDLLFYSYGGPGAAVTFKKSTGNVGIGTTSPAAKLHVVGGIYNGYVPIGNLASANLSQIEFGERNYTFSCQLDNNWRTLINNIDGSSFIIEIAGGDAGTKYYIRYYITASNVPYGVISSQELESVSGGWNTGACALQTSSAGGSFILQFRATSYYSGGNTGNFEVKIRTF